MRAQLFEKTLQEIVEDIRQFSEEHETSRFSPEVNRLLTKIEEAAKKALDRSQ
jgi:hypothetical protein